MSGQDMRKLMENLNKETPKEKLDESIGGTPIANDIMELAAKLEAIQNTPETEEVDETLEENMYASTDPVKVGYARELSSAIDSVIRKDDKLMRHLPRSFNKILDEFAPGWDNDG